jgi:glucosamine--fructose-6-phosphate aminotransferase (isomerizing)
VKLKEDLFLKEILEQPHALRSVLKHWEDEAIQARLRERMGEWSPPLVIFTGMGSSLNACYPAAAFLNDHGRAAVVIESAELLHYYAALRTGKRLLVVVSQSGESIEPVRLMEELDPTAFVISLTNGLENTIARRSQVALDMCAGPELTVSTKTYVCAQFALLMLAYTLGGATLADKLQEFEETAADLENFLNGWSEKLQPLVDMAQPCSYLSLVGRGPSLASALDGAQMLKEAAHKPAEAVSGGQFRHGAMELVSPDYGYILFPGDHRTRELMLRLGRDISGYGAKVAYIGGAGERADDNAVWIPFDALNPYLAPVLDIVPLQLLARSLAALVGRTVNCFDKMSKVIRTE